MTTLHHLRRGTGEPTVLLHGAGSRLQVWQEMIEALSGDRDVIAVDLPGFGQSAPRPGRNSVADLTDAVQELLDRLGVERPHVAGFSLGGAVALELGRRGSARSVVAFAPVGFWGATGVAWCRLLLGAMAALTPAVRPALPLLLRSAAARELLFGLFYGAPRRQSAHVLVDDADAFMASPGLRPVLDAFGEHVFTRRDGLDDIPVTVVWGTRDRVLPRRTQARRARRALPHALHVALPGAGHVAVRDDPVAASMLLLHQWAAPSPTRPGPATSRSHDTDVSAASRRHP